VEHDKLAITNRAGKRSQLPIHSGKVTIADTLPFIVDVLRLIESYRKKDKRNLRNAVRGRIEYAYQRNTFGKAVCGQSWLDDRVDAKEFLTWACAKWPELAGVEGIQKYLHRNVTVSVVSDSQASGEGFTGPGTFEEAVCAALPSARNVSGS
jgi:hypothetical protein